MKIYCYYFRPDGSVEKKKIVCRKNKDCYAFNRRDVEFDDIMHVPFEKIGCILSEDSWNDNELGCRMYLKEEQEITDAMRKFAEFRSEKLIEMEET